MPAANTYPIEKCSNCGKRNRIRPHSLRFKPICGDCKADLPDPYRIGEEIWWNEGNLPIRRLSFELLPPGSWNIDDVIAYYRREAQNFPTELVSRAIEWQRLVQIKSLRPEECYVGTNLWLGYVVFAFRYTEKVVLECPVEGNATYVLSKNWKYMVRQTKQELRRKYATQYVKVVHRGSWLDRVRSALR
ncbi:MAG: hypothetical protein RBJ76_12175 [Stenomitos frigidus ULC029]